MSFGLILGIIWSCAAIWFIAIYNKRKQQASSSMTENDVRQLEELLEIADSMAERIKTLESILDVETPDWRDEHDEPA